jgi:hypothetical protein
MFGKGLIFSSLFRVSSRCVLVGAAKEDLRLITFKKPLDNFYQATYLSPMVRLLGFLGLRATRGQYLKTYWRKFTYSFL